VDNREIDISQIIKYHNGELDAKAMHQIEKLALDDPFVMDAIEGLANKNIDQPKQINDIKERLASRINKPERKIIPWRIFTIAASITLVIGVSLILFVNRKNKEQPKLAQVIKPQTNKVKIPLAPVVQDESKPKVEQEKIAPLNNESANNITVSKKKSKKATAGPENNFAASGKSADMAPAAPVSVEKDSTPLNEMIVMDYSAQKKSEQASAKAKIQNEELKKAPATAHEQLLRTEAPGLNKTTAPNFGNYSETVELNKMVLKGRVVSGDDGLPVAGAFVKVAGTSIGTVTNSDGTFALRSGANKNKVLVAFAGYQTKEFNLNKGDSAKVIALDPSGNALSEVIVGAYNGDKKAVLADSTYQSAHPKDGWSAFKKYLKSNKTSPDGKKGSVKVSFEVNYNGKITTLKVLHSLSEATDKKALDLIKNGPQWSGNTSGKPETVVVKIKFE